MAASALKNIYDASMYCTYNVIEDEMDSENLYRIQFLQACKLTEWNGQTINQIMDLTYELLLNNEKGLIIIEYLRQSLTYPSDNSMLIIFLFSYDYFHLFHACLIDLIRTNDIKPEHFNSLIDKIKHSIK
jgi:hypothetical protein